MSYTDLIQEESIKKEYLVIVKPYIVQDNWSSVSGNIYFKEFTLGYVIGISVDGSSLDEGSSTSPGSDEFYYDRENERVYINVSSPSTKTIVVNYELYYSTKSAHWYRVPTDNSTTEVYFEPFILKPPVFKYSLTESLFGYLPSQSTSMDIDNSEHHLEKHLNDASFFNAEISLYHWLSSLNINNIKLLRNATIGNITENYGKATFNVKDQNNLFLKEFRPSVDFYSTSTFSNLDSAYIGRPIRFVYGYARDIKCVNIDFEELEPTTSNNRVFVVRSGALSTQTKNVSSSPSSTTTRTYLDSVTGLNEGDNIKIDKASDEYTYITSVGANYIEHPTLSVAAVGGDDVIRPTASQVWVEQDGTLHRALYDRDYTESFSDNVVKITFNSSMESNLGINTISGITQIFASVYGKTNDVTKGGSPFGSDSTNYESLTSPAVILYDILKTYAGIPESRLDSDSFDTLQTAISNEEIGFAIPKRIDEDFPKLSAIITEILKSNLILLFLNNDNKWEVKRLGTFGTEDYTIEEDEIVNNSLKYNIDYTDIISDIIVQYKYREYNDTWSQESDSYTIAKYLHRASKQMSHETLLLSSSDASTLAEKLSYIFGERKVTLDITNKDRFMQVKIGDIIKLQLEKLLGYDYTEGTENIKKFRVLEIQKGLKEIGLTLDDAKGIEDNSGSF